MGRPLLILSFIVLVAIFFFLGYFLGSSNSDSIEDIEDLESSTKTNNSNLDLCNVDSDCVIVPFDSCCGSTKRAINKAYLEEYNNNPEVQKFDNPDICALMGVCQNDENVTRAECKDYGSSEKRCSLVFS